MCNNDLGQLFSEEEVDIFLSKTKEKCEKKLRGRTFAGMEQDDVVQEVLIKVYKSLDTYDNKKAKLSTYVDRVIENMIKDSFKKCASNKNLALVNALEIEEFYSSGEGEEPTSNNFSVSVGEDDLNYMLYEIMSDIDSNELLTLREKEILMLHYKGYEKAEIATMFGLSKARITQIWKSILLKIT